MQKAIMAVPQVNFWSVVGLTSFTKASKVIYSPMQESSIKILIQLETRDFAGLQNR